MKYKTFLYQYYLQEYGGKYLVVRKSWLFGLTTKFLNRYGEFTSTHYYFDNETTAEIRLKKFLQNEGLF